MLRLTDTPATSTQPGTPTVRLRLTSRSNLAVRGQRAAHGLSVVHELPRSVAMTAVRDAAALGYRDLVIEGGEPLLHRGLADILARASRHSLRTTLVSNGTLLHQVRNLGALAPHLSRVAVELHGLEATHDAAADRPGAFARTIDNLALLRTAGITFGLRLALSAGNVHELPAVLELAASQGACGVEVTSSWDGGLGDDDAAAAIDAARPHAERLGLILCSDLIDREELMLFRGSYVPVPAGRQLTAAVPTLVVEPSGRLLPIAPGVPKHLMLGNLHTARLSQLAPIWLRSDRPRRLADAADRAWWSAVSPDAPRATRWDDELPLHIEAPETGRTPVAA